MPLRFAVLLLIACSLFSTPAWSVPAAPIEIEITQSDGTTFIATPKGDEFANWMETESGHSIVIILAGYETSYGGDSASCATNSGI